MRVYVHDEKTEGVALDVCTKLGVDILTPEIVRSRDALPEGFDFFLDQVDALIIEITEPTRDIQFILAQAILAGKPTLCLYAKNQPPRELLSHIKQKTAPRPIKTFSYVDATLAGAIKKFMRQHDPDHQDYDDVPSIKYTLRLTPRIERYLSWRSTRDTLSKADLIRDILKKSSEQDEPYSDEHESEE